MAAGYREFEFDLPAALLKALISTLDEMERAPLTPTHLAEIPEAQGVYQLFLENELVYIGKTDAEAGLNQRLNKHSLKIQNRKGLPASSVTFKAVRIFVFTAMDLETVLIKHYASNSKKLWNGSGFGANDPGSERDTTKPSRFDQEFPINIELPLPTALDDCKTAAEAIQKLKVILPYKVRFERVSPTKRQPHKDLENAQIVFGSTPMTAREAIEKIASVLPPGWQATALSSGLILYKHHRDDLPGQVLARSPL